MGIQRDEQPVGETGVTEQRSPSESIERSSKVDPCTEESMTKPAPSTAGRTPPLRRRSRQDEPLPSAPVSSKLPDDRRVEKISRTESVEETESNVSDSSHVYYEIAEVAEAKSHGTAVEPKLERLDEDVYDDDSDREPEEVIDVELRYRDERFEEDVTTQEDSVSEVSSGSDQSDSGVSHSYTDEENHGFHDGYDDQFEGRTNTPIETVVKIQPALVPSDHSTSNNTKDNHKASEDDNGDLDIQITRYKKRKVQHHQKKKGAPQGGSSPSICTVIVEERDSDMEDDVFERQRSSSNALGVKSPDWKPIKGTRFSSQSVDSADEGAEGGEAAPDKASKKVGFVDHTVVVQPEMYDIEHDFRDFEPASKTEYFPEKPNDYLRLACIVLCFCNPIFGLIACAFSSEYSDYLITI